MSSNLSQIIDLLLAAYFTAAGPDRTIEQVPVTRPLNQWDFHRLHHVAFLSTTEVIEPALLLRAEGPFHFRDAPISMAIEALRDFFIANYYLIYNEVTGQQDDVSYKNFISEESKSKLALQLKYSSVFSPKENFLLFPLTPVSVESSYIGYQFAFVSPNDVRGILPEGHRSSTFSGDVMLPLLGKGTGAPVSSWLMTQGASDHTAKKFKRIVLGALSLGPIHRERYGFVLRPATKNYLHFSGNRQVCTSNPHTPPLSDGLIIRSVDHGWLSKLDSLLRSMDKPDRGKRNALDYLYRAWFLDPVERSAMMFMALEALYEHETEYGNQATAKLRGGITRSLQTRTVDKQLEIMIRLRSSIVHGGSPDVFASSKYPEYWRKFKSDLATDLEIITAKCLRREIFGDAFVPQADPHAALIAEHQALGHIPTQKILNTVSEWP